MREMDCLNNDGQYAYSVKQEPGKLGICITEQNSLLHVLA